MHQTLTLEPLDNTRLDHLCGPLDSHISFLAQRLGVQLTHRFALFEISGDDHAVATTVQLLKHLYHLANHPFTEEDLHWHTMHLNHPTPTPSPPPPLPTSLHHHHRHHPMP